VAVLLVVSGLAQLWRWFQFQVENTGCLSADLLQLHIAGGKVCGPAFRIIESAVRCCGVALFGTGHGHMDQFDEFGWCSCWVNG
jgi:hypothetical protein